MARLFVIALIFALSGSAALAQERTPAAPVPPDSVEALRARYRLGVPGIEAPATLIVAPSLSISSPVAFGADWGDLFAALGYQQKVRYANKPDAVLGIGGGLGSARENVGIEVVLAILDTYTDFFEDRTLSVKAHRRLRDDLAVAVGVENLVADGDGGRSAYGVVSKVFRLSEEPRNWFQLVAASVGVGGGRFRREAAIRSGEQGVNVFADLTLLVNRRVSVIADYTGQDVTFGASLAPFPSVPVVFVAGVADVTGAAGDGARLVAAVALGFRL